MPGEVNSFTHTLHCSAWIAAATCQPANFDGNLCD